MFFTAKSQGIYAKDGKNKYVRFKTLCSLRKLFAFLAVITFKNLKIILLKVILAVLHGDIGDKLLDSLFIRFLTNKQDIV